MDDPTRPVPTRVGTDGTHLATTLTSPTSNTTRAQVVAPPSLVIPIVFVPGIMGSNLKARTNIIHPSKRTMVIAKAGSRIWNVDSATSPASWLRKDPDYRQLVLNKDAVAVDEMGHIEEGQTYSDDPYTDSVIPTPTGLTPMSRLSSAIARKRGWGTVSWAFYGEFLDWLQARLEDGAITSQQPNTILAELLKLTGTTPPGAKKPVPPLTSDGIKKVLKFQFPVYAVGYNWLQSNLDSGNYLADKIRKEIIPTYHGVRGQTCEKVIVVTHSMGGLVTRAAAVTGGAGDCILGVIHGVMPTDGAAAFYKRLAAGFGSEGGGAMGYIQSLVLGHTARDTTPVIAYNPGPLELAPNKRYNGGKPWLFIKDAQGKLLKALPEQGDPYKEIYARTDVAWRAVTPEWLNPAKRRGSQSYWIGQYNLTAALAQKYHDQIGGKLHPHTYAHYSDDANQKAWGTFTWQAEAGEYFDPPTWGGAGIVIPIEEEWITDKGRRLSPPETWRFESLPTNNVRQLLDGSTRIRMSVVERKEPGDATVPAYASGGQLENLAGCQLACAHNPGYEHSASYTTPQVHHTVLDAITRLLALVKTS